MNVAITNQVVLTVDLEDWFHSLDPIPDNWKNYERRIEHGTKKLLDLLEKNKSTATFFILGDVARNHPQLIKEIYNAGHEIGSHGFNHNFIYKQSNEEFKEDLRKSLNLLSDLIGEKIISYRAPYFSITKKSIWAFDILVEEGIKVDSSVFPIINHRYGIPNSYRLPHNLENGLWEWPITTYKTFFVNVPFSGGIYFRFLPGSLSRFFLSSLLMKKEPVLIYIHPWELDEDQPRIKNISHFLKLRHYYGLNKAYDKLMSVFNKVNTISLYQGISKIKEK